MCADLDKNSAFVYQFGPGPYRQTTKKKGRTDSKPHRS